MTARLPVMCGDGEPCDDDGIGGPAAPGVAMRVLFVVSEKRGGVVMLVFCGDGVVLCGEAQWRGYGGGPVHVLHDEQRLGEDGERDACCVMRTK